MADDGYDFFAPQPRPQPRAKNTMFDLVPDAFTEKTLTMTGDHRRVKRPGTSSGGESSSASGGASAQEPEPVEEKIEQEVVQDVEAVTWEGVSLLQKI